MLVHIKSKKVMNVLMFGWEFPPNISGGLGTACYGIVKGLSECQDVNITFVIPKSQGNELLAKNLQLISADQVNVGNETLPVSHWSNIRFLQVQSKLVP
jgi:hypothetical protein